MDVSAASADSITTSLSGSGSTMTAPRRNLEYKPRLAISRLIRVPIERPDGGFDGPLPLMGVEEPDVCQDDALFVLGSARRIEGNEDDGGGVEPSAGAGAGEGERGVEGSERDAAVDAKILLISY